MKFYRESTIHWRTIAVFTFCFSLLSYSVADSDEATAANHERQKKMREIATRMGWQEEFDRGQNIIKEITTRKAEGGGFAIAAFRGETISLIGGIASPGATNDLVLENGFYLRVLVSGRKDLRPKKAAWWVVCLRGKILQVIPDNQIIVLEISEDDWKLIETG